MLETREATDTTSTLDIAETDRSLNQLEASVPVEKGSPSGEAEALLKGLNRAQKTLAPKYFYDQKGSELFEQITRLNEYYPTRTERLLLSQHASEIASICGRQCVLIEPGSGSCQKVRLLLNELQPSTYIPMDISMSFLEEAAQQLRAEFPWLTVEARYMDFEAMEQTDDQFPEGNRLVFYPGSTIGNMHPQEAEKFLRTLNQWGGSSESRHGYVLIGVDLHKDSEILNAAYNDAERVTERFNLNALSHLNRRFNAHFDLGQFAHHAFYNESDRRIEMHLISQSNQRVDVAGESIEFEEGETIHTENSYKYSIREFIELAESSGMKSLKTWVDDNQLFSLHLFKCILVMLVIDLFSLF